MEDETAGSSKIKEKEKAVTKRKNESDYCFEGKGKITALNKGYITRAAACKDYRLHFDSGKVNKTLLNEF